MGQAQLAVIEDLQPPKMTAAEAIAELREIMSKNRAATVYNKLEQNHKDIVCFAAGFTQDDLEKSFENFSKAQRNEMYVAVKNLAKVFNELSRFPLSEFNK